MFLHYYLANHFLTKKRVLNSTYLSSSEVHIGSLHPDKHMSHDIKYFF